HRAGPVHTHDLDAFARYRECDAPIPDAVFEHGPAKGAGKRSVEGDVIDALRIGVRVVCRVFVVGMRARSELAVDYLAPAAPQPNSRRFSSSMYSCTAS